MDHIDKQIAKAQAQIRALKKEKRLKRVKPFVSIKEAKSVKDRYDFLNRRARMLGAMLHRRCPHDWAKFHRYDQPDCDGMFGGHHYWKECRVCGSHISLNEKEWRADKSPEAVA